MEKEESEAVKEVESKPLEEKVDRPLSELDSEDDDREVSIKWVACALVWW